MGVILAKFRKEKSTEAVLEALQEKINTLETFLVSTQEQKKRIVGNFLAISIAIYVIAFAVFYFVYFPPTWKDRIFYFILPLLLFPIIIILLRYLFTWYFQRKLNKNSKKLTALKAEKKKILQQVMDKETYKVAVNLLARYADKPIKPSFALTTNTPNKPTMNRSQLTPALTQVPLPTTPHLKTTLSTFPTPRPQIGSQIGATSSPATALLLHNSGVNQQLRRRTPFPIVNQKEKGVLDRIVDIVIGDGPQDRFAMICKECYSHNGMALKEDFEYTTFRCAFCNALNPSRKNRPIAPRLSVMPAPPSSTIGSDTSDSEDDKDDSDNESVKLNINKSSSLSESLSIIEGNNVCGNTPATILSSTLNSEEEDEDVNTNPQSDKDKDADIQTYPPLEELLKKSDAAIEDKSTSPE